MPCHPGANLGRGACEWRQVLLARRERLVETSVRLLPPGETARLSPGGAPREDPYSRHERWGTGCFTQEAGGLGRRWTHIPKPILPVPAKREGFKGAGGGGGGGGEGGVLRAGEAGALALSQVDVTLNRLAGLSRSCLPMQSGRIFWGSLVLIRKMFETRLF